MSWLVAVRSLHIAASMLVAGAVSFELLVLRRTAGAVQLAEPALRVRRWLRALGALGIGVALVSWAAWLAEVAIAMTGLPPAEALSLHNLGIVVSRTTFGRVWVLRLVLLLLLVLPLLCRKTGAGSVWRAWGTGAVAAVLVASLAWTGHAVASHAAHLWVDAAHLCAAAVWIGMLPPLWLLVQRACATGDAAWLRLAGRAARLFSAPAVAAVLVLALTGALNSWWLVGAADRLLGGSYGLLLSGKLAVFAFMLALAASNRMVLTPRIDQADALGPAAQSAMRLLRRNVLAEVLLAAAVVALVGALGVTPPAAHDQTLHHHDHAM